MFITSGAKSTLAPLESEVGIASVWVERRAAKVGKSAGLSA